MPKSLVIVESPAKAKTINKFLGKDYIVKPTGGHVVDLPEKEIGIDVENGFTPKYRVIKGKSKMLTELKKAADKADTILLATDPDREGEAIAWHVANQVVKKGKQTYRVMFNQITKNAVLSAIEEKTELDMNKVNAQQARRVLDRLVGYKVSPFLWKTVYKGLSAGRVQSVALRLIVERDAEIDAFVPDEYWHIDVQFDTESKETFIARLMKQNGKNVKIVNEDAAKSIVSELSSSKFTVSDIVSKPTKRNPLPPFITSTMQQEASRRHGFGVTRTMRIAQGLYEGIETEEGLVGLITYMRTDSTRIAPEGIEEAREHIGQVWGSDYLPAKPNVYRSKKGAQDAHEAIRPTSVMRTPAKMKPFLTAEQLKLYTLVWNRFVASQMSPARFTVLTLSIAAGNADVHSNEYLLRASDTHTDFPGFLIVYKDFKSEDDEENESSGTIPKELKKEDSLTADSEHIVPSQHFTKPPARFSEATLVRELESRGIGRPSTYAQIINTIQQRDYVKREKSKLFSTELGKNVNKILVQGFPELFNFEFTAGMEEELDKIESGEDDWLEVISEFYGPFSESLEQMNGRSRELKESLIEDSGQVCEKCGKPMVIRWGRNGKFIACSGFPECRNTKPLEEDEPEKSDEICDKCGSPMEIKTGRYGRFLACSNYPECKNNKPLTLGVKCPLEGCDGDLVEKRTKRGKVFYGCNKYPKCKFASWTKPVSIACPNCGAPSLVESKNGEELTCQRCQSKFEADAIKG